MKNKWGMTKLFELYVVLYRKLIETMMINKNYFSHYNAY